MTARETVAAVACDLFNLATAPLRALAAAVDTWLASALNPEEGEEL